MHNKISRVTVGLCSGLFVLGLITGILHYFNRSATVEAYVPGSSAIVVHVVLAVVAALVVIWLCVAKRLYLLAVPFSVRGFVRYKGTLLLRSGVSVGALLRVLVSLFLSVLFLYNFWRAGDQVIGGLDPNYVVNAWGGPSYLGASLAHWLDAALLMYVQACLLHVVMVRPVLVKMGRKER